MDELAQKLLDAQVEYVLGELRGRRLTAVIERDVDDVLSLAGSLAVRDVLDEDVAKTMLRRLVEVLGNAPLVTDLVAALSDALYSLAASDDFRLGDVIERDPVEALVVKVLSMQQLHDRALDRMAESPIVATVATRFVGKIISDFVEQNRQFAERLPGAKSLFAIGTSAASRVMSNPLVGNAAEKGTKLAIRRTNSAIRDLLRDAPLHGAAMEVWDMHADEPVGELREYLSERDLRELVLIVHQLLVRARSSDYVGHVLDECVAVFFERYGDRDVASLLPELGVSRDDIVRDLRELLPPVIATAERDGRLAELVRARLAPFYASKKVQTILSAAAASP